MTRKSAVGIAIMLRAERTALRIPAAASNFSLLKNVHTGYGAPRLRMSCTSVPTICLHALMECVATTS